MVQLFPNCLMVLGFLFWHPHAYASLYVCIYDDGNTNVIKRKITYRLSLANALIYYFWNNNRSFLTFVLTCLLIAGAQMDVITTTTVVSEDLIPSALLNTYYWWCNRNPKCFDISKIFPTYKRVEITLMTCEERTK